MNHPVNLPICHLGALSILLPMFDHQASKSFVIESLTVGVSNTVAQGDSGVMGEISFAKSARVDLRPDTLCHVARIDKFGICDNAQSSCSRTLAGSIANYADAIVGELPTR